MKEKRSLLRCKSQEELSLILDELIAEANEANPTTENTGIENDERTSENFGIQKTTSENQVHDKGFDIPEYLKAADTENRYKNMTSEEIDDLIEEASSIAATAAVEEEYANIARIADEVQQQQEEYAEWLYWGSFGW